MNQDRAAIALELLILRCQRGERAAFEELIRDWERRLYFYVRRLVSDEDEAWAILQEVWLHVLRGIHALRESKRFSVWLYTITRNTVMSHHRGEYAHERLLEAVEPVDPTESIDALTRFDNAELVHYGLSRIPKSDREILTLFFLQDLSVAEVAEVLRIPVGTVKSRLFKARRLLKDVLENERGDQHGGEE